MTGKKRPAPRPSATRAAPPASSSDEEARFIQALIARGEAARAVDGELPEGATHEIVEDDKGRVTVVRRRFID